MRSDIRQTARADVTRDGGSLPATFSRDYSRLLVEIIARRKTLGGEKIRKIIPLESYSSRSRLISSHLSPFYKSIRKEMVHKRGDKN